MRGSILDGFAYRVLKAWSHDHNRATNEQISARAEDEAYDASSPRSFLSHVNRYFELDYRGQSVIDVGCGKGDLTIMLAKSGARRVVGVDIDPDRIAAARRIAQAEGVADLVCFKCTDFVTAYRCDAPFDIVLCQSAFEHILSPLACLLKIHACLTPGGVFVTVFGPLWWSPYGAHMRGFTPIPWVHFLFPERVVLRVRRECYRPNDDAGCYEEIRGHLNRITVGRFKREAAAAGFTIETIRLNPPQDQGRYRLANAIVNAIPFLQELGSLQLLAVLRRPSQLEYSR
ncbi:MAG: class I SAM-dependent methyltransferase [Anaerolineae bacterium]|nr:class I SAM-dependent methyltransferase [Anaerolineae bacterium]